MSAKPKNFLSLSAWSSAWGEKWGKGAGRVCESEFWKNFLSLLELGPKGGVHGPKKIFFFSKNEFFFAQKSDRPNFLLKAAKNRFVSGHLPKTVFFPAAWHSKSLSFLFTLDKLWNFF